MDLSGKRVLELDTASGFLCFYMENLGADVVAYDLSDKDHWDIVPFSKMDHGSILSNQKGHVKRINNSYWLSHRAYGSQAKVVYGSVYEIPQEIGPVDVAVFGCILLHLRDPFLALEKALRCTRETVIVTDILRPNRLVRLLRRLRLDSNALKQLAMRRIRFLPDYRTCEPSDTWWSLTPHVITEFIGVLGFEEVQVQYYEQIYKGNKASLYTVVGHKASGAPEAGA